MSITIVVLENLGTLKFEVKFFNRRKMLIHSGTFYVEHSTASFIVIPLNKTNLGTDKQDVYMTIDVINEDGHNNFYVIYVDRIDVMDNCTQTGRW